MEFDFVANAAVDSLDTVPEVYRGLYVQKDGKHVISDVSKGIVEAYTGTTKALKDSTGKNKGLSDENAKRRLALKAVEEYAKEIGLEGDDIATVLKAHIADLTDKVKGGAELKINLDKIKDQHTKNLNEALGNKDKDIAGMQTSLSKYLVDREAAVAIAEAKGSPTLLLPHVRSKVKVVRDGEDDDGTPKYVARVLDAQGDFRSNGKGGFMSVKELVAELKADPEFARTFESEVKGGNGLKPGGGRTTPLKNEGDKNPTQKISAGLNNRARAYGAGAR